MNGPLRVLMVSAEMAPFARSGEAGDAAGALAPALARLGVEVAAVLPKYRRPALDGLSLSPVVADLAVPLGADKVRGAAYAAGAPGSGLTALYLVDHPRYFHREAIFGSPAAGYPDNDERFAFFSRAVVELVLRGRLAFDVLHCHGWPAALVPLFLKTHYAARRELKDTASVLSLHGAGGQGGFPPESLALTGLSWDFFTPDNLALNGRFSFLKAGLLFADALQAGGEPGRETAGPDPASATALETLLARRGDAVAVIPNPPDAAGWEAAAKAYIKLYVHALAVKRGGSGG